MKITKTLEFYDLPEWLKQDGTIEDFNDYIYNGGGVVASDKSIEKAKKDFHKIWFRGGDQ